MCTSVQFAIFTRETTAVVLTASNCIPTAVAQEYTLGGAAEWGCDAPIGSGCDCGAAAATGATAISHTRGCRGRLRRSASHSTCRDRTCATRRHRTYPVLGTPALRSPTAGRCCDEKSQTKSAVYALKDRRGLAQHTVSVCTRRAAAWR